MSAAEQELLAQVLVQLAQGIATALGHDPADPAVDAVIRKQFADSYEQIVLGQYALDGQ